MADVTDFDFLRGAWNVRHRRLHQRLAGCQEWDAFAGSMISRPLLDGRGNEDEYRTPHWPDFVGMAFRFFNPATRLWAIYWVDSRRGVLEPPVHGGFCGDRGEFEGDDIFEGRPVRVRFLWSRGPSAPRWEQAFSADGGATWESNWVMEFVRSRS